MSPTFYSLRKREVKRGLQGFPGVAGCHGRTLTLFSIVSLSHLPISYDATSLTQALAACCVLPYEAGLLIPFLQRRTQRHRQSGLSQAATVLCSAYRNDRGAVSLTLCCL